MKNPTISSDLLAQLTGFTSRWLRDLAASGHIPKSTRGNYPRDETLKRLFAYLRERTAPNAMQAAKLDREQSKARKERVAADLAEKKVVPLEEVRREWSIHGMRAKFLIYDSVNQISAQATMHLGLSQTQNDKLREIVKTHQHRAVVEIHQGKFCKVICPKCKQELEIPPRNYENPKS
jgi:hypothetical protein